MAKDKDSVRTFVHGNKRRAMSTQAMGGNVEGNTSQPYGKGGPLRIVILQPLVGRQQRILNNLLRLFTNRYQAPHEVKQTTGVPFHQKSKLLLPTLQHLPDKHLITSVLFCLHI